MYLSVINYSKVFEKHDDTIKTIEKILNTAF